MVKLLFMLIISIGELHAATLSLIPEKSVIERGRALTVNMHYVGPVSPDDLNINRWQSQVFIDKRNREERRLPDGRVEVKQRLTLYPKSTGPMTLGPLALGGAQSKRFDLLVTPSVVNQIDITPIWAPLPDQIWQGESIESCLSIPLSEQRSRVKVELPEIPGVLAMQTQNRTRSIEGGLIAERCWLFSAHQPGRYLIDLPPIIQRGRGRWIFYLPYQEVEVLPLPSYLPNSISVGQPVIDVQQSEKGWTISVQKKGGHTAQPIWGLKSAIAEATGVPTDQIIDLEGAVFVPFNPWSFGQISTAKIPFFNTTTGRLDAVEVNVKAPWNLPLMGRILSLILGLVFLVIVTHLGKTLMLRRENVQTIKRSINAATSADQVITVLLASGSNSAKRPVRCINLQQWADAQNDQEANALAISLNQLAYGKCSELTLDEIKRRLICRINF